MKKWIEKLKYEYTKMYDYGDLTPVVQDYATSGLQLIAEIAALEAEIERLECKVEDLEDSYDCAEKEITKHLDSLTAFISEIASIRAENAKLRAVAEAAKASGTHDPQMPDNVRAEKMGVL